MWKHRWVEFLRVALNPKVIVRIKSNSGDDSTAADLPTQVRYLNCIGEDVAHKHTFHSASFIECSELKLVQNSSKHFTQRALFNLDLSEDVLTDLKMLQKLLNKARWTAVSSLSDLIWCNKSLSIFQDKHTNADSVVAREQFIYYEKEFLLVATADVDILVPIETIAVHRSH